MSTTQQQQNPQTQLLDSLKKLTAALDGLTKQILPTSQGGANTSSIPVLGGSSLFMPQGVAGGFAGATVQMGGVQSAQQSMLGGAGSSQDFSQFADTVAKSLSDVMQKSFAEQQHSLDRMVDHTHAAMTATISSAAIGNPAAARMFLSPDSSFPLSELAKRAIGDGLDPTIRDMPKQGIGGYASALGAMSGMFTQAVQQATAYQFGPYINEAMAKGYNNQIMAEMRGGDFRSIFDFSGGGYLMNDRGFLEKSLVADHDVLKQITDSKLFDYGVWAQFTDKTVAGASSIGSGVAKGGVAGAGSIVEGVGMLGFGAAEAAVQFQTGGAEALRGVTLAQIAGARRQSNVVEQQVFDRLAQSGQQLLFTGMSTQGYSVGKNNDFYGLNADSAQYLFGERLYNPNSGESLAIRGGFTPDQMLPYLPHLSNIVGSGRLMKDDKAFREAMVEYQKARDNTQLPEEIFTDVVGRTERLMRENPSFGFESTAQAVIQSNKDIANNQTSGSLVKSAYEAGLKAYSLKPKLDNAQTELQGLMGAGYDPSEVLGTLRFLTMAGNYSPAAAAGFGYNFAGGAGGSTRTEDLQITQNIAGFALGGSNAGFVSLGRAGSIMNAASGGISGGNQVYQSQMSARALQELEGGSGQNTYLRATRFAAYIRDLQQAGVEDPSQLFTAAAALSQHSETEIARRPEGVMDILRDVGAEGAASALTKSAYGISEAVFSGGLASMQAVTGVSTGGLSAARAARASVKNGSTGELGSGGAPMSFPTESFSGSSIAAQQAASVGEAQQFGQTFIDVGNKVYEGLMALSQALGGKGGAKVRDDFAARRSQADKTSTNFDDNLKAGFDNLASQMSKLNASITKLTQKM